MLRASVCIATYRRAAGLRNLLHSLTIQEGAPAFEVIVVDNDRDASAAAIAEEFSSSLSLRYFVEPKRGLSRVRNKAVLESRGNFIAFIDDDEVAGPHWLATIDRVRESSQATAVFGPVHIEFEPAIPKEIRECHYFRYPAPPEGSTLEWCHSRTSNAYVERAALPSNSPFDVAFDHTGGEDIDLFFRMAKTGAKFVYAGPDGAVTEFREKSRSDLKWLLRRSFRNGSTSLDLEQRGETRRLRATRAARAVKLSAESAVKAIKARQIDRGVFILNMIIMGEEVGKIARFFGYSYKEYSR